MYASSHIYLKTIASNFWSYSFLVETIIYDCDFGDDGILDRCGFDNIESAAVLPDNTYIDNTFSWDDLTGSDGYLYLYGYINDDKDIKVG